MSDPTPGSVRCFARNADDEHNVSAGPAAAANRSVETWLEAELFAAPRTTDVLTRLRPQRESSSSDRITRQDMLASRDSVHAKGQSTLAGLLYAVCSAPPDIIFQIH